MKKIILFALVLMFSNKSSAQQELIDNNWSLHYMVIDGVTHNVPPPSYFDEINYNPGIMFFETSAGYGVTATIHFNVFFTTPGYLIINADTFTVLPGGGGSTLGECWPYCELESLYLGQIFISSMYDYEIIDESNGNKILIITNSAGNIAVHGNYLLGTNQFDKKRITLYPNPVEDTLKINSDFEFDNIQIYSLKGQQLMNQTLNRQIDVSGLTSGIYFAQFSIN